MPLSDADTARLYSDAFAANMKTQLAENGFALCDLKTQLDVSKLAAGVLQDELTAVTTERDTLATKWAGSTEGKDEALQAEADRAAGA